LAELSLANLSCRSVFDGAQPVVFADRSQVSVGRSSVKVCRVRDVLYVPDLRIQVVGQTLVPAESIQEPSTLGFEQGRNFQGRADHYRDPFPTLSSDVDVCILSNFYSRNFYHWLTEELMKVTVLEASGFRGPYLLTGLPSFAVEFMLLMGVDRARLIETLEGPTVFRSALYTEIMCGTNITAYGSVFFALRERLLGSTGRAEGPRRIWMDRRLGVNNPGRGLVNVEEVYSLLARYGFEVMDMAAFPVARQVAIAAGASALSGSHGAGFAHVAFMPPRSAVIECFSPLFINPGIYGLCHLMEHRYSMVVHDNAYAGYPHGKGLMVNCELLELMLKKLGSE